MLLTLFTISFLSATLLPGGSEALFLFLLTTDNYSLSTLVIIATLGNSLGGMTNYLLGYLINNNTDSSRLNNINPKWLFRAQHWISNWGSIALLFAWLPIIGDILCLVAGWYKLTWWKAFIFILVGKALRYISLALLF